ncbi:MAG: DUF3787 domain-containing protein [Clostridiales bacterium]|nr:DUF3787 domain-containing protein [Bacillota bacterium]NLK04037.1 DUF3787 domain-containing protein [Clostridiales bacterium]
MKAKDNFNFEGKDNKRLNKTSPTNKEGTAAWQNFEGFYKVDQVGKPSEEDVIDAKEWVDNGSRL